jgi:hypothetical protein
MLGLSQFFAELLTVIGLLSGAGAVDPIDDPQAGAPFSVGGAVTGLVSTEPLILGLGDTRLEVDQDGPFVFADFTSADAPYEVFIVSEPPRFDCDIERASGFTEGQDVSDIEISCSSNASAALFTADRLHQVGLTMTLEEWRAFELDTIRANYSISEASGRASPLTSFSHSEVYRQADFSYLNADGTETQIEKVGFKMQGNTSRQYPVDQESEPNRPRRFAFSIKFDEEFDEDESVYACIDFNGLPAAVSGEPCYDIVGQDLPDYPEADGREFMDIDKLRFRFNRDDPTYQREVLAHELLNAAGVPAARAVHAQVALTITGTEDQTLYQAPLPQTFNMGVFTMMEQIDKPFLKLYYDKNGYLFKVGAPGNLAEPDAANRTCDPYEDADVFYNENFCVIGVEKSDPDSALEWLGEDNYQNPDFVNSNINSDGPMGNVSQFLPYQPTYDLKTKKKSLSEAREALQDFVDFVQARPTAEALAQQFDVPGFIKAQAMEIVLGAVDHYVRVANNYYLYFNEPTGRWIYIPTDFDYTLIDVTGPNCAVNSFLPICQQTLNVEAFTDLASTTAFNNGVAPHWAGRFFYPNYPPILWEIVFGADNNPNSGNRQQLYREIEGILDRHFDWALLGPVLAERRERLDSAITATDAADAETVLGDSECSQIYNPAVLGACSAMVGGAAGSAARGNIAVVTLILTVG